MTLGYVKSKLRKFRTLDKFPDEFRGGVLSIGNFDGVHCGHAQIIAAAKQIADRRNAPLVIFTFDPHPAALVSPNGAPPALTTSSRKAQLLEALGVNALVEYSTDRALLQRTPEAFFSEIVLEQLAACALVEGNDFCFGKQRQGNVDVLQQCCQRHRIELRVVEPVQQSGQPVSSSRIRKVLAGGQVELAAQMLNRPYRICGQVASGSQRGTHLGFPTANLHEITTLVPGLGVYAGWGRVAGTDYPAAIHIGPNPTFHEDAEKVEVHLIGLDQSIYEEAVSVDFVARLRDVQPFDGIRQLKRQLTDDVASAQEIATKFRNSC